VRSGPAGLRASGATIRPCAASDSCRSVEGTSGKPSGAEPLGFPTQAASAARTPGHACPGRSNPPSDLLKARTTIACKSHHDF